MVSKNLELDAALRNKVRRAIREGVSPRHVPAEIHAVPEVPRTIIRPAQVRDLFDRVKSRVESGAGTDV